MNKMWCPVTGHRYVTPRHLLRTAKILILNTLLGTLAMRWHSVAVGCSWNPFLGLCEETLARAQSSVCLWFVNTIRLRLYAAHRVQQRALTASMSVLRRLCHKVPTHIRTLESNCRSSVALTATIAGAHLSHLLLAHHIYSCGRP